MKEVAIFAVILTVLKAQEISSTLSASKIARNAGYSYEKYYFRSEDGYYLMMERIRNSQVSAKRESTTNRQVPVLLMHGLLGASDLFSMNGENSTSFNLANQGYDVWIGNLRGNKYSSQHLFHTQKKDEFWDFSLDEFALDLVTQTEAILQTTSASKVHLIAHSLSASAATVALIEYQAKMEAYSASITLLAPIYRVDSSTNFFINYLASNGGYIDNLQPNMGTTQWFGPQQNWNSGSGFGLLCSFAQIFCNSADEIVNESSSFQTSSDAKNAILSHFPSGTSEKFLKQLRQLYSSGQFKKYDYGSSEANIQAYGSSSAPSYSIGLMSTNIPLILFQGNSDRVASLAENRNYLLDNISDSSAIKQIISFNWGHYGFLMGTDSSYLSSLLTVLTQNAV